MSVMSSVAIPDDLRSLTPEWVTAALQQRGQLQNARVVDLKMQTIGLGRMGAIARVQLTFEGDPGEVPTTLIAKLPTEVNENRIFGEISGMYWREILFYEELRDEVPVRTPRLWYSAMTVKVPPGDRIRRVAKLADWFPQRVLERFLALRRKQAAVQRPRYLLLMEDMTPARAGDMRKDSSIKTCDHVLRAIAALHATFWKSPRLADVRWLNGLAINPRMRHRLYMGARAKFVERHKQHLTAEDLAVLDWIDRHGPSLSRIFDRDAPPTVIHCDLRFDNVLFNAESGEPIAYIDWQLAAIGPAAFDVAYFLSAALDTSVSQEDELALLHVYHQTLLSNGVTQYPFELMLRDYRRGLLAVIQILCSSYSLDLGAGVEMEGYDRWVERAFVRLRGMPLVDLLSPSMRPPALAHGTQRTHG
jgi:hypothetical protein